MSVTAAAGFAAAGVAAGIKPDGARDLALVAAASPVPAAAVFTTNTAPAAPVILSRDHLAVAATAQAVVLNSGCANAATGPAGAGAALAMAEAAAKALGCPVEEVLVCSTGLIGTHLPSAAVVAGVGAAASLLDAGRAGASAAAEAILTTDTVTKEVTVDGAGYRIGGMAKGAGMLRPDMATMLAVLTTDAAVSPEDLADALGSAVAGSFNSLNVDGCMSTNDTVIVLASGASGVVPDPGVFAAELARACRDLAEQMALDAEGSDRVVRIAVSGATDDDAARALGRAIADWDLVRAAFYGGDPNWGRVVGAMGASGLPFDIARVAVSYQGIQVARDGVAVDHDGPGLAGAMSTGPVTLAVRVGDGPGRADILTTDLTPDYVRLNAEPS